MTTRIRYLPSKPSVKGERTHCVLLLVMIITIIVASSCTLLLFVGTTVTINAGTDNQHNNDSSSSSLFVQFQEGRKVGDIILPLNSQEVVSSMAASHRNKGILWVSAKASMNGTNSNNNIINNNTMMVYAIDSSNGQTKGILRLEHHQEQQEIHALAVASSSSSTIMGGSSVKEGDSRGSTSSSSSSFLYYVDGSILTTAKQEEDEDSGGGGGFQKFVKVYRIPEPELLVSTKDHHDNTKEIHVINVSVHEIDVITLIFPHDDDDNNGKNNKNRDVQLETFLVDPILGDIIITVKHNADTSNNNNNIHQHQQSIYATPPGTAFVETEYSSAEKEETARVFLEPKGNLRFSSQTASTKGDVSSNGDEVLIQSGSNDVYLYLRYDKTKDIVSQALADDAVSDYEQVHLTTVVDQEEALVVGQQQQAIAFAADDSGFYLTTSTISSSHNGDSEQHQHQQSLYFYERTGSSKPPPTTLDLPTSTTSSTQQSTVTGPVLKEATVNLPAATEEPTEDEFETTDPPQQEEEDLLQVEKATTTTTAIDIKTAELNAIRSRANQPASTTTKSNDTQELLNNPIPTLQPSVTLTRRPTETHNPTANPTHTSTSTAKPILRPTTTLTRRPTSDAPSGYPSVRHSGSPSANPSGSQSSPPTTANSAYPTSSLTTSPSKSLNAITSGWDEGDIPANTTEQNGILLTATINAQSPFQQGRRVGDIVLSGNPDLQVPSLAASRRNKGILWVVSNSSSLIYAIDSQDGHTRGTLALEDSTTGNPLFEKEQGVVELAVASIAGLSSTSFLYIVGGGSIITEGEGSGSLKFIQVYRVQEPQLNKDGVDTNIAESLQVSKSSAHHDELFSITVTKVDIITLIFPADNSSKNYQLETLMVDDIVGEIIVTVSDKDSPDNANNSYQSIYASPEWAAFSEETSFEAVLELRGELLYSQTPTAGDISPFNGAEVLIKSGHYLHLHSRHRNGNVLASQALVSAGVEFELSPIGPEQPGQAIAWAMDDSGFYLTTTTRRSGDSAMQQGLYFYARMIEITDPSEDEWDTTDPPDENANATDTTNAADIIQPVPDPTRSPTAAVIPNPPTPSPTLLEDEFGTTDPPQDEFDTTDPPGDGEETQILGFLDLVGSNGKPLEAFPLQVCQGDCDTDNECDEALICLQRDSGDLVPVFCEGTPKVHNDYCVPGDETSFTTTDLLDMARPNETASGVEPFVPGLLTHIEYGLLLSSGLTARIIAHRGKPVPYDVCSHGDDRRQLADCPCLNGGTCFGGMDEFDFQVCVCPQSFSGLNCEVQTDHCIGNPCLNGGNCVSGGFSYTCQCLDGFAGENCETHSLCDGNNCQNGGRCVSQDGLDTYTCDCPDGFAGYDCEIEIDPFPAVTHVGTNGNPAVVFPLGLCEGDCDTDDDCDSIMVCHQRDKNDAVPGCAGGEEDSSETDYCIAVLDLVATNRTAVSAFPLSLCQGHCNTDADCEGGLVCFEHASNGAVPGCGFGEDVDLEGGFCIAEDGIYMGKVREPDPCASDTRFHIRPDFGATFEDTREGNEGGWIYVTNSENTHKGKGGVGGITFDKYGRVLDYKTLLTGTTMNCGGGRTPWDTWVSCEETGGGKLYQVDPTGQRVPEVVTLGGQGGAWESFAYDIRNPEEPHFFVTEDKNNGALERFTPDGQNIDWASPESAWSMLHGNGTRHWLELKPKDDDENSYYGTFSWTTDRDIARESAQKFYPHTEGIDIRDGILWFVCKNQKGLYELDLDRQEYKKHSTERGLFDGQPDQIQRILKDGEEDMMYFTEEGGRDAGVHGRDANGVFFTLLESPIYIDETTGLAFSPDGVHMYVAYQHNGFLFDITRQDKLPFSVTAMNLKVHATPEK